MTSRKEFLVKGGLGVLGLAIPSKLLSNSENQNLNFDQLDGSDKDWKTVRKAFPLSKDICYLNNGTLGPSPQSVLDIIQQKTEQYNKTLVMPQVNKLAKQSLANYLGVSHDEIALTHNVTEGINIAAWGVPLKKGDEVILTNQEHVGNALPWLNRKKVDGIELKVIVPQLNAEEFLGQIRKAISPKTKVIAIPHIPCTTGQVYPIKEICELARSKNIYTIIDGAHGTGMLNLDLKELNPDVYLSCCHKWLLGPKGTGYMYIKKDLIPTFRALFVGGHSDSGWELTIEEQKIKGFHLDAHKYHYGTQNHANFFGISAAVDFHLSIGKERIESRIKYLNNYLFDGLKKFGSKIEMLSPKNQNDRAGVLTFKLKNIESRSFVNKLRKLAIVTRYLPESDHHAIRVSTHIYNDEKELDFLLKIIRKELK